MALVLQDNTGTVAGANAYISVAAFKAYHDARGNTYAPGDPAIEFAIIKATDYLDQRFNFVGRKLAARDQETSWPRMNAYDSDRQLVNGIPLEVQEATAEYALRALTAILNPDPTRDASGATVQSKSEQVGPIAQSVTYVGGAVFIMPKYPAADQRLIKAGLVRTGGTLIRG
jgi:hypothetical protein